MDDRPLEEPEAAISRIDAKLADVESTILARLARLKAVGDVEPAFRPTPKEGTLFMQGQTVSRTTYAALWQWVQEVGAVYTGGYGNGDGSTTFTLPDLRGRVLLGSGTLGADTYALGATGGASSRTLSVANMPAHDHNVNGSTGSDSHNHSINDNASGGNHGNHNQNGTVGVAGGATYTITVNAFFGNTAHVHGGSTSSDSHTHSLTLNETTVGSGTAFDNRPPYLAINWAVWT